MVFESPLCTVFPVRDLSHTAFPVENLVAPPACYQILRILAHATHCTYAWQKGRRHEAAGDVLVVAPLRAGDEHAVLVWRAVLPRLTRRRPRDDVHLGPLDLDVGAVVGREVAVALLVEGGVPGVARVAVLLEHAVAELGPLVEEGVARRGKVGQ